jgi:hypothetical protein
MLTQALATRARLPARRCQGAAQPRGGDPCAHDY